MMCHPDSDVDECASTCTCPMCECGHARCYHMEVSAKCGCPSFWTYCAETGCPCSRYDESDGGEDGDDGCD